MSPPWLQTSCPSLHLSDREILWAHRSFFCSISASGRDGSDLRLCMPLPNNEYEVKEMRKCVRCWESALYQTTPLLSRLHQFFVHEGFSLPLITSKLLLVVILLPEPPLLFLARHPLCWNEGELNDEGELNRYIHTMLISSHQTWAKKIKHSFWDMQTYG